MITIRQADACLRITGHAGQAPAGQDIVCAAVSTLFYTLLDNLQAIARQTALQVDVCARPGRAWLRVCGDGPSMAQARQAFAFANRGFALLAAAYGDFVRVLN